MTHSLVACCVASLLTTASQAETLRGYAELVDSNIVTFEPSTFMPGPNVDTWNVIVENNGSQDATSLELSFPGAWVNLSVPGLSFLVPTGLPSLGLNLVADTYFLLPSGTTPLDVGTIDTDELLQSTYTVAEDTALVPAGGSAVVAVLSVLTGEPVDDTRFTGRAAVGGRFPEIAFPVPEPSGVSLLAALFGMPRRRPCRLGKPPRR